MDIQKCKTCYYRVTSQDEKEKDKCIFEALGNSFTRYVSIEDKCHFNLKEDEFSYEEKSIKAVIDSRIFLPKDNTNL